MTQTTHDDGLDFPQKWELRRNQEGFYEFIEPLWSDEVEDHFDDAYEAQEDGDMETAEAMLREGLEDHPEYLDGWLLLANLYFDMDQPEKRLKVTQHAVEVLQDLLPDDFDPTNCKLPWDHDGSAILLRMLYTHACALADMNEYEAALHILEDLLLLDPEDNQGSRYLLPGIYLELDSAHKIIELRTKFPEDCGADLLWNLPLAYLQMGQQNQAVEAIRNAQELSPRVGSELLRKEHKAPRSLPIDGIEVGSEHEAYAYFLDAGDLWKNIPGAMNLLRATL